MKNYNCIHCEVPLSKGKSGAAVNLENGIYFICENKICKYREMHGFHINDNCTVFVTFLNFKDKCYYFISRSDTRKTTINENGYWWGNDLFVLNKFIDLNSKENLDLLKNKLEKLLLFS